MSRFTKHLFICNNQRDAGDPRGCCASRGSCDLLDHAKKRIHELGMKGRVRVNKAGCLDACQHGPAMVVYPEGAWYAPRTREDMDEIIDRHIQGGQVVERLQITFKKK
jgi:(2Fe-2S) ferredoxin